MNIASWNGKLGAPNIAAYSATKAAVIALTQALAREVASHGIRVNAVCPGIVAGTRMREQVEAWGSRYGLPLSTERVRMVPGTPGHARGRRLTWSPSWFQTRPAT